MRSSVVKPIIVGFTALSACIHWSTPHSDSTVTTADEALEAERQAICAKPPSTSRVEELRVLAKLHGLKPLPCMPDLRTALSEATKDRVPPAIWAEVKRLCREGTNAEVAELLKEYDFSEVVCPPVPRPKHPEGRTSG